MIKVDSSAKVDGPQIRKYMVLRLLTFRISFDLLDHPFLDLITVHFHEPFTPSVFGPFSFALSV